MFGESLGELEDRLGLYLGRFAEGRADDRDHPVDLRRGGPGQRGPAGAGGGTTVRRSPLRHLRLHRLVPDHRRLSGDDPPGVRLRPARDAGGPCRHRGVDVGWCHQRDAGADPPRRAPHRVRGRRQPSRRSTTPGSSTSTRSAIRSSTASTRGGICTRRNWSPATPRSRPSSWRAWMPRPSRLCNFVEKATQATLVGDVFDDAATGQGLLNFFARAINSGAITEQEAAARTGVTPDGAAGPVVPEDPGEPERVTGPRCAPPRTPVRVS